MLVTLRNLLARPASTKAPSVPDGERVYAIGDIHGRLDLFEALVDLIETDDASRPAADTTIVLLGDLIDRGPESAGVVALAREWASRRHVAFLLGNHEEMLLVSRQDADAIESFLKFGGLETIQSYGVPPSFIGAADPGELQRLMNAVIPLEDFQFIESFQPKIKIGDYLFVHAGVRPGIPLDLQSAQDCRWIREPFLSNGSDFGAVVIHGHTIAVDPVVRANRIGIDTGAYLHGTLTAIGLEGTERWFLQATDADEQIDAGAACPP